jgi:hypothetical protein
VLNRSPLPQGIIRGRETLRPAPNGKLLYGELTPHSAGGKIGVVHVDVIPFGVLADSLDQFWVNVAYTSAGSRWSAEPAQQRLGLQHQRHRRGCGLRWPGQYRDSQVEADFPLPLVECQLCAAAAIRIPWAGISAEPVNSVEKAGRQRKPAGQP